MRVMMAMGSYMGRPVGIRETVGVTVRVGVTTQLAPIQTPFHEEVKRVVTGLNRPRRTDELGLIGEQDDVSR